MLRDCSKKGQGSQCDFLLVVVGMQVDICASETSVIFQLTWVTLATIYFLISRAKTFDLLSCFVSLLCYLSICGY